MTSPCEDIKLHAQNRVHYKSHGLPEKTIGKTHNFEFYTLPQERIKYCEIPFLLPSGTKLRLIRDLRWWNTPMSRIHVLSGGRLLVAPFHHLHFLRSSSTLALQHAFEMRARRWLRKGTSNDSVFKSLFVHNIRILVAMSKIVHQWICHTTPHPLLKTAQNLQDWYFHLLREIRNEIIWHCRKSDNMSLGTAFFQFLEDRRMHQGRTYELKLIGSASSLTVHR